MSSTVTRRLADSLSYVVLSSSASGQLTLPLVDPNTGKTEHYALMRLDTPFTLASLNLSPRLHTSASRLTVSDTGHPHPRPRTQKARRLERLAQECMLDVSLDALRMLEEDHAWPSRAPSSSYSTGPFSAERASSASASATRRLRADRRTMSMVGTPSLVNESQSDVSVSSVGTPVSRSRSRRQEAVRAFCSASAANRSAVVGLGIMGMTKEDGSPFDGLGSLPRNAYTHTDGFLDSPAPSASASASGSQWNFCPELCAAAFASDEPEDPVARFWKTATAADFRRYLDDSVSAHQQCAPLGASGSWMMAKRTRNPTFTVPSASASASKTYRKRFSMPRAEEDLFMCQSPVAPDESSLSNRIMGHLEGTKTEEEFWTKAWSVYANLRPASSII